MQFFEKLHKFYMLDIQQIRKIVDQYDLNNISIGTIGSHSALEIMDGAKDENIKTVCICQKDRENHIVFHAFQINISLDKFSDIINEEIQARLRDSNTIIVTHTYCLCRL